MGSLQHPTNRKGQKIIKQEKKRTQGKKELKLLINEDREEHQKKE